MSLTPERVEDIRASSYAQEIPPVMALCEDWIALRKQAEEAMAYGRKNFDAAVGFQNRALRAEARIDELVSQLAHAEAKMAGVKQEWRVTFLYSDGTADESFNHPSKDEALQTLTAYRESLPNSCTDFRLVDGFVRFQQMAKAAG